VDTDLEALYRQYSADVYRFAVYLCGDRTLAEDIAAETFVRAWTSASVLELSTVKGYLFAIARNLYLKSLQQRQRHVPYDPDAIGHDIAAEIDIEGHSLQKESLQRVLRGLQQLSETDRSALLLRSLEDMPYEEISRVLGLPVTSIKVKVHRARQKLAQLR
jgi:RNA polymerase sigma-70 factor (ECF subfamily)